MKNFIQHLFYISDGYINLILHLLHIRRKKLYSERISLCKKCPKRKHFLCNECGCVIYAKSCVDFPISEIDNKSIGGCPLNPPTW